MQINGGVGGMRDEEISWNSYSGRGNGGGRYGYSLETLERALFKDRNIGARDPASPAEKHF